MRTAYLGYLSPVAIGYCCFARACGESGNGPTGSDSEEPEGNPVPVITSVNPASLVWKSEDSPLVVNGSGFSAASVILWNGVPQNTVFDAANSISTTIAASELTLLGQREVAVRNPPPGGGTSTPFIVEITLDPSITSYTSMTLRANDVIYDPMRDVLYASVASSDVTYENDVVVIDPETPEVVDFVQVGSNPAPLALSDDGQYLYVGLSGAPSLVRVALGTRDIDLVIDLGNHPMLGPFFAEDLVVLPGSPNTVLVSRYVENLSPRQASVVVFDDDVERPVRTGDANRIEPSGSGSVIYGYNNETTEFGARELLVSPDGLTEGTVWTNRISGFDVDIAYADGKLFSSNGTVLEAATGNVIGDVFRHHRRRRGS